MQSIYKYWGQCANRGDHPKPVFAILRTWWTSADTGDHVAHWELTRARAARWIAAQPVPTEFATCKMEYLQ